MPAGLGAGGAIASAWVEVSARDRLTPTLAPAIATLGRFSAKVLGVSTAIGAMTMAIKKSADAFISYDREIHNTWTLLGKTRSQMEAQGSAIRAMARDYNVSATEAVKAMYMIHSATFYNKAAFDILKASIRGAAAGLSDVIPTARMLTAILNAWGMSADNVNHINDLLFTTIRYGVTTMPELVSSFGRLAGIAAPAGASIEEMTAAIATLTRQGIQTDWAVTALRQSIMQFIKPTKDLKEVIHALGYETGVQLIRENKFAGALKLVTDYAEANGLEISKLFTNVRAVTAVLPLATTAADAYAKDQERMANATGQATLAFQKQTTSWAYQIQKFKTLVGDLAISFGKTLMPSVKELIASLSTLVNVLRPVTELFSKLGGGYAIAIAGTIGSLAATFWLLQKAVVAVNAALTTLMVSTSVTSMGKIGISLGAWLAGLKLARGSILKGVGSLLGGLFAASFTIKQLVNFDLRLGQVSGIESVKRGLISGLGSILGAAISGALFGGLPGAIAATAIATGIITIKVIHEIQAARERSLAAAAEDVKKIFYSLGGAGALPEKLTGISGIAKLAKDLLALDGQFVDSRVHLQAMMDLLRKYYVSQENVWGFISGYKKFAEPLSEMDKAALNAAVSLKLLSDTAKEAAKGGGVPSGLANLSIGGLQPSGGLSFMPGPAPSLLLHLPSGLAADFEAARKKWDALNATLQDSASSAESVKQAWKDMGSMISDWSTIAEAVAKSYPELSAKIKAQVKIWQTLMGEETVNPIIKSANDFKQNVSNLIDAFKGAQKGSLTYALALKGLQDAHATLTGYVDSLDSSQVAAAGDLLDLISQIEALGITSDNTRSAVEIFNDAIANVSMTLGLVSGQISTAFADLEAAALRATKLGDFASAIQGLISGAGAMQSTLANLERVMTGNYPQALKEAAAAWYNSIRGSYPQPGKTFAEQQREQEEAYRKQEQSAREAASAAKTAAQEAKRAMEEAAQAAQDAFKHIFEIPAMIALQKGNWEEAAKVVIQLAQNRGKLIEWAKNLAAVNGKTLDQKDVLDLIINSQSTLLGYLDKQIKVMQLAGEDASKLETLKTKIKNLFDPLGGLKDKIKEILGISVYKPFEAGGELRKLLEQIIPHGFAAPEARFQTGGPVPGFGRGDKIPAILEPGEFIIPQWMMRIPWLAGLIRSIWKYGRRLQKGGDLDLDTGFGTLIPPLQAPISLPGFSPVVPQASSGPTIGSIPPRSYFDTSGLNKLVNAASSAAGAVSQLGSAASTAAGAVRSYVPTIAEEKAAILERARASATAKAVYVPTLAEEKAAILAQSRAAGAPTVYYSPEDLAKAQAYLQEMLDKAAEAYKDSIAKYQAETAKYKAQAEEYNKAAEKSTKQAESMPKTMEELEKALEVLKKGNANALVSILKNAKVGGTAWKAIWEGFEATITQDKNLISQFSQLGKSTRALRDRMLDSKAGFRRISPILVHLSYDLENYADQITSFVRTVFDDAAGSLTEDIFKVGKQLLSINLGDVKDSVELAKQGFKDLFKAGNWAIKGITELGSAFESFLASGALNAITAIFQLISAILDMQVKALEEKLKKLQDIFNFLVNGFEKLSKLLPLGTVLSATMNAFISVLKMANKEGIDLLTAFFDTYITWISAVINSLKGLVEQSDAYQALQKETSIIWKAISNLIGQFLWPLVSMLRYLREWLGIQDQVNKELSTSLNVPSGYKTTRAEWAAAKPGVPGISTEEAKVPAWADAVGKKLAEMLEGILKDFGIDSWSDVFDAVQSAVQGFWDWVVGKIPDIRKSITDSLEIISKWLSDNNISLGSIMESLEDGVQWLIDNGPDLVSDATQFVDWLNDEGTKMINWILNKFPTWKEFKAELDDISKKLEDARKSIDDVGIAIGGLDFTSLTNAIKDTKTAIDNMKSAIVYAVGIAVGAIVGALVAQALALGWWVLAGAAMGAAAGGFLAYVGLNKFQEGGIVPGPTGLPRLAVVHGGETIIPASFNKPLAIGAAGTTPVFLDNRIIIDGREIYRAVKRAAWDEDKRMTGSSISGRSWRIA